VKTLPLKALCIDNGQYGLNIAPDEYVDAGVRLFRTSDLSRARDDVAPIFVPGPLPARYRLQEGDLLLSRSGTVGVAHRVTGDEAGSTFAGFLVRFRPRPDVDSRWLSYCTRAQPFQEAVRADAIVSTISNFNAERYAGVRLFVVGIEAQRRIADFLDHQTARLDASVAAARRADALLEQRALTGVHDAVTGRGVDRDRTPSLLSWTPDLPAHWQAAKLSLLARMGTGHTPSRSDPELWVDTSIPWLTTNDVHRFRRDEINVLSDPALSISPAGLANSAAVLHPAGTVALSRTASAGFSVLMGRDMATSQDFVTWTCGPRLLPHYLLAVLRASRQDLLGRLAMGSTHKTIYFPDLEALRVPLPPVHEQERAVEAVRRVQQETRELRAEVGKLIDLLEERKRALITACVTGQFDVTTASNRAGDAALQGLARPPPRC
jgi:type I restriction enzyme S subunit